MEPGASILKLLRDAVTDLTYPSDSEEPWEAFAWPAGPAKLSPQQALLQRVEKNRAIVEVPVEMFFEQLSEADNAEQYTQLRHVLQSTLNDLRIFRVGDGEVRVDVYLVGVAVDGSFAGAQTVSVET